MFRKSKTILLSAVILSTSIQAKASIPQRIYEIDFHAVQQIHSLNKDWLSKENFVKFCPSSLTPTTDQNALSSQLTSGVGGKLAETLFNETLMEQPTLKSFKQQVDEISNHAMVLNTTPAGVEQKLGFRINAAERLAIAEYDGYFHSDATYRMSSNDIVFSLSKPLNSNTTVALQNVSGLDQFSPAPKLTLSYRF